MKILHVLASIERSGAESMLYSAGPLFRDQGAVCELVATGESIGARAEAFTERGTSVHHLPFAKSPAFFGRLWRLVRDSECDVVHVHTERAALWVELTARLAGVHRVIRTVHGHFEPTGWLRLRRAAGRWLATKVLGVQHVYVSRSVASNEQSRLLGRGVLIPNGIDSGVFAPAQSEDSREQVRQELGFPRDCIVMVTVGSCIEVKQHEVALRALASLVRDGLGIHYLHVGDGPLCADEQRLARELGLADVVVFASARDDVPRLLGACDIFVMPSRREALPVAALEASACGLPVVAYDAPGLRDVVEDQRTGLLVEPRVERLAEGIAHLSERAEVREAMGLAGRRKAEREYSLVDWVSRHLELYGAGNRQSEVPDGGKE